LLIKVLIRLTECRRSTEPVPRGLLYSSCIFCYYVWHNSADDPDPTKVPVPHTPANLGRRDGVPLWWTRGTEYRVYMPNRCGSALFRTKGEFNFVNSCSGKDASRPFRLWTLPPPENIPRTPQLFLGSQTPAPHQHCIIAWSNLLDPRVTARLKKETALKQVLDWEHAFMGLRVSGTPSVSRGLGWSFYFVQYSTVLSDTRRLIYPFCFCGFTLLRVLSCYKWRGTPESPTRRGMARGAPMAPIEPTGLLRSEWNPLYSPYGGREITSEFCPRESRGDEPWMQDDPPAHIAAAGDWLDPDHLASKPRVSTGPLQVIFGAPNRCALLMLHSSRI